VLFCWCFYSPYYRLREYYASLTYDIVSVGGD
jgi:hypothetical protein